MLKFSKDGKMLIEINNKEVTHLTIPDGVTGLGRSAFLGCKALQSIDIPNSVTEINEWAFLGCSALQSINVSADNPNYTSVDGVLYDKGLRTIIKFPCKKDMTGYRIPDSVINIGYKTFGGCKTIQNFDIPYSVAKIGPGAFERCIALQSINVSADNPNYTSVDGVLYDKELRTIIKFPCKKDITEYNIPDSVTYIEDSAFHRCETLQSIEIPNSVTEIGNYAFHGCNALQSIHIPNSVTYIGEWAFRECSSLQSTYIPDSVTEIKNFTFAGCPALQGIHIRITDIENADIDESAFDGVDTDNCVLYIPEGTEMQYRQHPVFGKFKNIEIEKQE